jgi:hypothetical protein
MPSQPASVSRSRSLPRAAAAFAVLGLAILACATLNPAPPSPSVFDSGRTAYGFFPTPPEFDLVGAWTIYRSIARHGDVVLLQSELPWEDFRAGTDVESSRIDDIRLQVILAWQNGLEPVFVVDPLNGLDRRQFANLPPDMADGGFGNPAVRAAFRNFALRIARDYHPRYLGLASEINTYADAHPEDFPNFLSLYRETYQAVKAESPATQVFVTFQWEDINNVNRFSVETDDTVDWDRIEAFEPELDLWVISSYPFVAFDSAADIPDTYYASLRRRTDKPLAVGEGGFGSQAVDPFRGTPHDQTLYLNAVHDQIGDRLAFWIYLILDDFNMDSYGEYFRNRGLPNADTLRFFSIVGLRERDGTPKEALAVWDGFRN